MSCACFPWRNVAQRSCFPPKCHQHLHWQHRPHWTFRSPQTDFSGTGCYLKDSRWHRIDEVLFSFRKKKEIDLLMVANRHTWELSGQEIPWTAKVRLGGTNIPTRGYDKLLFIFIPLEKLLKFVCYLLHNFWIWLFQKPFYIRETWPSIFADTADNK